MYIYTLFPEGGVVWRTPYPHPSIGVLELCIFMGRDNICGQSERFVSFDRLVFSPKYSQSNRTSEVLANNVYVEHSQTIKRLTGVGAVKL